MSKSTNQHKIIADSETFNDKGGSLFGNENQIQNFQEANDNDDSFERVTNNTMRSTSCIA